MSEDQMRLEAKQLAYKSGIALLESFFFRFLKLEQEVAVLKEKIERSQKKAAA